MNSVRISNILKGSIAEESGIEVGDVLLTVDGKKVIDIFDYRFLITEEELLLEVLKENGEIWEIEIEKDQYEDLGIDFEDSLIDGAKSCCNRCIFCFIDQLPKGMRKTLYFKDDDSRLSFLSGNYVTLTNVSDKDIERIIQYRMSPINVSVHTTDPKLREKMLGHKRAGDVMDKIKQLTDAGITVNCQIVLCPTLNDGENLNKTVNDLVSLYPGVYSISVVPVGLTKHREGLFELIPFDENSAKETVNQVEILQNMCLENFASRVVYLADEFYLMAKIEIPSYEDYEDFPQIENGVGLLASLEYEFDAAVGTFQQKNEIIPKCSKQKFSIATGVSAYPTIKSLMTRIYDKFGVNVEVYAILNKFFGEKVTVTGLITGQDIVNQLKGKELGERLILCSVMFKADEQIFLDDYTLKQVSEELHVSIDIVKNSGYDLLEKILSRGGN